MFAFILNLILSVVIKTHEGGNVNQPVNRKLFLFQLSSFLTTTDQYSERLHRTDPPVTPVLNLSFIREQDPEIPELLHLRQGLSTDPETTSHLILLRS